MGTTLTGTTPQDTYDSLIKVTDNGPLSGTAKYLSDGLGNDSALALNTRNLFVGTTSAAVNYGRELVVDATALTSEPEAFVVLKGTRASGNVAAVTFRNGAEQVGSITMQAEGNMRFLTGTTTANTSEKMRIDASGNVGIGTSAPDSKLHVAAGNIRLGVALDNTVYYVGKATAGTQTFRGAVGFPSTSGLDDVSFSTHESGVFAGEVARFTGTQYLRFASGTGGIQFNGDTAAANALDDYEEGTWTPSFVMGTSGTVTMDSVLGRYTKVGNLVTCTGYANAASVSSPVGELRIAGLPFTTGTGGDSSINIYAYGFGNTTAVTAYQGFTVGSLNYAIVRGFVNGDQVQNIGANVVGSAGMIFTITYRV